MPLIQSNLEDSLVAFFENPPETAHLCALAWANSMKAYVLPIVPFSTSVVIAAETMAETLTPIFETSLSVSVTAVAMEAVWGVFAATVGVGMLPGWASTPPAGLVGFLSLFEGPRPLTHRAAGANFAHSIHLWMLTGIATNTSSGTVVSWS